MTEFGQAAWENIWLNVKSMVLILTSIQALWLRSL